jgi:aspartyl-tRNA(Asn)/glutamyl-tRNA(Gln) amidotransferase subunit A
MDPTLVESMAIGRSFGAVELQQAMGFRSSLYKRFAGWFARFDALVTPTLARTAVDQKQELFGPFEIDGVVCQSLRADWYPYTHPFNLTGHPAITLPCGFGGDGLPIGLQLVGPWDADALLLQIAGLLERRLPWADKRPPL